MIRPARVKAKVNLSAHHAFEPKGDTENMMRIAYGEDNYVSRFQEPGVIEDVLAKIHPGRP